MTKQEIAIELSGIDWTAIECDSTPENDQLHYLGRQLMKLPKHEVIDLLFHTIGACMVIPELQVNMKLFRYVNDSTGDYLLYKDGEQ